MAIVADGIVLDTVIVIERDAITTISFNDIIAYDVLKRTSYPYTSITFRRATLYLMSRSIQVDAVPAIAHDPNVDHPVAFTVGCISLIDAASTEISDSPVAHLHISAAVHVNAGNTTSAVP